MYEQFDTVIEHMGAMVWQNPSERLQLDARVESTRIKRHLRVSVRVKARVGLSLAPSRGTCGCAGDI
jgi:hypothetical protein